MEKVLHARFRFPTRSGSCIVCIVLSWSKWDIPVVDCCMLIFIVYHVNASVSCSPVSHLQPREHIYYSGRLVKIDISCVDVSLTVNQSAIIFPLLPLELLVTMITLHVIFVVHNLWLRNALTWCYLNYLCPSPADCVCDYVSLAIFNRPSLYRLICGSHRLNSIFYWRTVK